MSEHWSDGMSAALIDLRDVCTTVARGSCHACGEYFIPTGVAYIVPIQGAAQPQLVHGECLQRRRLVVPMHPHFMTPKGGIARG